MPLTPDQERAVSARQKVICVDAGAGSGKTRVLVQRILSLIEDGGVELMDIAAITFTEKAALEMKARLRDACRKKATPDDARVFGFWRRMERQVETSRICTIHAFCSGVLRENALSRGLDPDFAIQTEAESYLLRSETIASTLHDLLEADDPSTRLVAVEYGISALSEMLDGMLQQRGLIDRVLRDSDYSSAVAITAHWKRLWPSVEMRTLTALCRARKLRQYQRELECYAGAAGNPDDGREILRTTLVDRLRELAAAQTPRQIRALIGQIALLDGKKRGKPDTWNPREAYDRVNKIREKVKDFLEKAELPVPDFASDACAAELTAALVQVYTRTAVALQAAKMARNMLDFDDLIVEAAHVLRETSRGEDSVRARTARSIKHLLIDEFQDTDGLQLEIAKGLADEPGGPSLFFVGDAKQSIYYFRGAEVDVFRQARSDADVALPMLGNFRTAPAVLSFINDFFTESGLLEAVEPRYQALVPQVTPQDTSHIEFLIPPEREGRTAIEIYRSDEAAMIAARLREACDGASRLQVLDSKTQSLRAARYGDAAILLRSLSNVHLYERALREAGVPYILVAGKGFYERQEVLDFRNLLTVIVAPWDELALTAFLRSPMAGLSDDALVRLAGGPGAPRGVMRGFYSEDMTGDTEQDKRLAKARTIVSTLRGARELPLSEFLHGVLNLTGFEAILLRQFMGVQRASNLRKICALADSFSGAETPQLRAFVRYLDEMAAQEIREGEAAANTDDNDSVTLMTVHKSKGLEFPLVFVADMGREAGGGRQNAIGLHKDIGIAVKTVAEDGSWAKPALFDAMNTIAADEETAEQARVLYVAMTRSRDHLFLCGKPVKAESSSWLAPFEALYRVCGYAHGATFDGSGWRTTVRREVGTPARHAPPQMTELRVDFSQLQRQLSRIVPPTPAPVSIAVTQLIRAMHPGDFHAAGGARTDELDALTRGTLAHALLQRWNFQGDIAAVASDVLQLEPLEPEAAARFAADAELIAARLLAHPFGQRIAADPTLRREVPFVLRIGGRLLRGTMDALLEDAVIIDYKTGRPTPQRIVEYETQLRLYAEALRQLRGASDVSAHLLFVDCPGELVVNVDVSKPAVEKTMTHARSALEPLTLPGQAFGEAPA